MLSGNDYLVHQTVIDDTGQATSIQDAVGRCDYTNPFSQGAECKEYLGGAWDEASAGEDCLAPVIGVPLPLFSYGGSSLLSTMLGLGLLMNVSMRRFVH